MHKQQLFSPPVPPPEPSAVTDAGELKDFATLGWFTLDRRGVITAANPAGVRLLSRAPDQRAAVSGQSFAAFLAETDQSAFANFLAGLFAG
ncbi:MAG: PAS domain-containing protein, partial [Propionivibrio sp.]